MDFSVAPVPLDRPPLGDCHRCGEGAVMLAVRPQTDGRRFVLHCGACRWASDEAASAL